MLSESEAHRNYLVERPSAACTCGWLTHEPPVIPAKRGEAEFSRTHLTCVRAAERVQRVLLHPGQQQALNGIARFARDSQKLYAGGSAPAPWVTFFARAKKVTKESTPPDGATASLCFSPESALASTRRARTTRLGLKHEARFFRFRLRCSAAATGSENLHRMASRCMKGDWYAPTSDSLISIGNWF